MPYSSNKNTFNSTPITSTPVSKPVTPNVAPPVQQAAKPVASSQAPSGGITLGSIMVAMLVMAVCFGAVGVALFFATS